MRKLDRTSCEAFFAENPRYIEDGYDQVNLDWCEKGEDTGIVTKQGDKVVAINAEKSLMVVRLEREGLLGTEYNGYLAIVKDPSRVSLGLCRGMGEREGAAHSRPRRLQQRDPGHQRLWFYRQRRGR